MHRRDHVDRPGEQVTDGLTEGSRRQLHLAEFVDHHYPRRHGERRYGKPLERGDVDAILPDPGRAVQIDVGQHGPGTVNRFYGEANPLSGLA